MTQPVGQGAELILIVDDVPQNIQVLASALSARGYRIAAATSGRQALQFVEKTIPDLICLDIMMPEMDGFETCRQLKASEPTSGVPIITSTDFVSPAATLNATTSEPAPRAVPVTGPTM